MRMPTVTLRALFAIGVVVALPAAATAQRWGRAAFPSSGACFFEDREYRGDYFCVRAGDDIRALPDDMNDRISSIRVFGGAEVVVFRDVRFNGGSSRFDSSVRNLRAEGWRDRVSSLRVTESRDRDSRSRQDDRRDRRGEDPDRIVRRAYQDIFGRDPDETGLRQYRSKIIDDNWSEAQVREALRNSPEFRQRARANAEQIVRRAYLAVLKREPDSGSEGYINNVLRDNWSQEDVERELRKSAEFRGK